MENLTMEKVKAELDALDERIKKESYMPPEMEIRIIGLYTIPEDEKCPKGKKLQSTIMDIKTTVKRNTTVREIKDIVLTEASSLYYFQLDVEYMGKILRDNCTFQTICRRFPRVFVLAKIIHVLINVPDLMFKDVFESFTKIGVPEEKALMQTKKFIDTYQNPEIDHEYEIAERLEKARVNLLRHGVVIRNATPPPRCD